MIPSFLRSVASQVRALVASGKAIHVNEQTARELELIAGLFEEVSISKIVSLTYFVEGSDRSREVTPSDIALGFLLASRAIPTHPYGTHFEPAPFEKEAVNRAAECAELAVLSEHAGPWTHVDSHGKSSEFPGHVQVHQGTREGARAAWAFIANNLQPDLRPVIKAERGMVGYRIANPDAKEVGDKYRRELEAMK